MNNKSKVFKVITWISIISLIFGITAYAEIKEIINTPPQVSFDIKPVKKVQLKFGYGADYTKAQIESAVNSILIPELYKEAIETDISYTSVSNKHDTYVEGDYYIDSESRYLDYKIKYYNAITNRIYTVWQFNGEPDVVRAEKIIRTPNNITYAILDTSQYISGGCIKDTIVIAIIPNASSTSFTTRQIFTQRNPNYRNTSSGWVSRVQNYAVDNSGQLYFTDVSYNKKHIYNPSTNTLTEGQSLPNAITRFDSKSPSMNGFVKGYSTKYSDRYQWGMDYITYNGTRRVNVVEPLNGTEENYGYGDYYWDKQQFAISGIQIEEFFEEPWTNSIDPKFSVIIDKRYSERLGNSEEKVSSIINNLNNNNAGLFALGSSANSSQLINIVNQISVYSKYIDNSNLNDAILQMAKDIISQLSTDNADGKTYVVIGDKVKFTNIYYNDREKDVKYSDIYSAKYVNPNYFKNPLNKLGSASYTINQAEQNIIFNNVGEFTVNYQARDNPKNDNRFDEYREYSNIDSHTIIAHRRPIAQFNIALSVNSTIFSYSTISNLISNSYDLDHQGELNNGIVEEEWSYIDNNGVKIIGKPIGKKIGDVKTITLRVKDIEGAWSIPYTKDTGSILANFDMKPVMYVGTSNPISDLSIWDSYYTYNKNTHWYVYQDMGSYTQLYLDNGSNVPNLSTIPVGNYIVRQDISAMDKFGNLAQDTCEKKLTVIEKLVNHKPIAKFQLDKIVMYKGEINNIKDLSYDPDGDSIAQWHWQLLDETGNTVIQDLGGNKPNLSVLPIGKYSIGLQVKDNPEIPPSLWSEPYILAIEVINNLTVEGQVNHTTEWNNNRIKYNRSKTGEDDSPRTYDVFFPGERFLLKALTTEGADCSKVIVNIQEYPEIAAVELTNTSNNIWEGDIWDASMIDWDNQNLNFEFNAIYANGIIKTDVVPVKVLKDEYWRIHRNF